MYKIIVFLFLILIPFKLFAFGDGGSDFCDDITREVHKYNTESQKNNSKNTKFLFDSPDKEIITYGFEPKIKNNGFKFFKNKYSNLKGEDLTNIIKKYDRFFDTTRDSFLNYHEYYFNKSSYNSHQLDKLAKDKLGDFLEINKIYSKNSFDQFIELKNIEGETIELLPNLSLLTHINDKSITEYSDYELQNIFFPNEINEENKFTFTIFSNNLKNKQQEFKLKSYSHTITPVELIFNIIETRNIDSNKGEHESTFHLKYLWEDSRLLPIAEKVAASWGMESGFWCRWTYEEWYSEEDWFLWHPDIRIKNIIEENQFNKENDFNFYYHGDEKKVILWRDTFSSSIFNSNFNFKNFPFDKQIISFEIMATKFSITELDIVISPQTYENIDTYIVKNSNSNNTSLPEWSIIDFNFTPKFETSIISGNETNALDISLIAERNFMYYVYKVLIPIFILLVISFSSYLIPRKQIESKLTLSIVCLLALIAYNFVIDESLPKLSYLTTIDYIILISYIFASIPSFYSVITFLIYLKNKNEGVAYFDVYFFIFNFIFYISLLIFLTYFITNNSIDTSSEFMLSLFLSKS